MADSGGGGGAPGVDRDGEDECPQLVSARVPVTILTGFLGSGKTTLLHYVLSAEHELKIAVIVNEFEFGKSIEKGLTLRSGAHADDEWVELKNGCMCCSASTATVAAIEALMARKGTFDLVLVETAGLADAAPVAAMFWQDAALCGQLYLSGIVALVDALHIRRHLADEELAAVAPRQVVVADKVVVNKCDLVSEATRDAVCALVRGLNPAAEIVCSCHARVPALRSLLFMDTTTQLPSGTTDMGTLSTAGATTTTMTTRPLLQLPHLHHGEGGSGAASVTALSLEFADATRMLALHARADVDSICKELLYANDDDVVLDGDDDDAEATTRRRPSTHRTGGGEGGHHGGGGGSDGGYEVLRCKAALWLYTGGEGAGEGAYTLLQLQSIGRVFDVHAMATATTPLCCSRVLVLGRRLDADVIRAVFARYLQPTVTTCTT